MTISETKTMAEGMPVLDLKCTVELVGKRRTGTGDYGDWSFQDIKIKDSTGEIWVKCGNKEPLDYLKGQQVTLSCFKSDKFGWTGLKTIDDSYEKDGQLVETRKLEMTKTGVIIIQEVGIMTRTETMDGKSTVQKLVQQGTQQNNDYWDGVNMRICRQNALTNSVKFYEYSGENPISYEDIEKTKNEVIDLANEFAYWTFTGKKKPKEETIPGPF